MEDLAHDEVDGTTTGYDRHAHVALAGRLSASFRAGMRPLALGTGLLVALSAPVADLMLERGDLARRSEARARQLSLHIANLGRGPVTVADLSGVAEAEEDVLQVELLDANGQRLVETAPPPKGTWPIIWGTAPTHLTDGAQATVRVAVTEPELIGRDLFLLAIFGLLGTFLTLALYFFPLRLFSEEDLVRLFARRSIKAVEEERLRLSRELHDGIAQSMGAAKRTKQANCKSEIRGFRAARRMTNDH